MLLRRLERSEAIYNGFLEHRGFSALGVWFVFKYPGVRFVLFTALRNKKISIEQSHIKIL